MQNDLFPLFAKWAVCLKKHKSAGDSSDFVTKVHVPFSTTVYAFVSICILKNSSFMGFNFRNPNLKYKIPF